MARADLLLKLVQSGSKGDRALFNKTVEALIAEERSNKHHVLAERLAGVLNNSNKGERTGFVGIDDRTSNLIYEIIPRIRIEDLFLTDVVRTSCEEIVEEHNRHELLNAHNLEPRHRILLIGPPGNGKTSLAEAIAEALMVPMIVIRYEGVIGTFLGETANRLKRVFEYVSTRNCVLFFDEFDTLGKERGDIHETGEIKRVVSSLLLQIDALPSHVVVITATNHPELLDRAVWRRFEIKMNLPKPGQRQITEWFRKFDCETRLGITGELIPQIKIFEGASYAELEGFTTDLIRSYVLTLPDGAVKPILNQKIKQWEAQRKVTPDIKE
ncbi:MAG: ATP-binding protein [Candidatus Zixiibacteriota bacterium]|jgi:SpoVK/Ycf46/Vps4 family AAA+-type ATPase